MVIQHHDPEALPTPGPQIYGSLFSEWSSVCIVLFGGACYVELKLKLIPSVIAKQRSLFILRDFRLTI